MDQSEDCRDNIPDRYSLTACTDRSQSDPSSAGMTLHLLAHPCDASFTMDCGDIVPSLARNIGTVWTFGALHHL